MQLEVRHRQARVHPPERRVVLPQRPGEGAAAGHVPQGPPRAGDRRRDAARVAAEQQRGEVREHRARELAGEHRLGRGGGEDAAAERGELRGEEGGQPRRGQLLEPGDSLHGAEKA